MFADTYGTAVSLTRGHWYGAGKNTNITTQREIFTMHSRNIPTESFIYKAGIGLGDQYAGE